eukprot:2821348-Amphidinium_carterae.1
MALKCLPGCLLRLSSKEMLGDRGIHESPFAQALRSAEKCLVLMDMGPKAPPTITDSEERSKEHPKEHLFSTLGKYVTQVHSDTKDILGSKLLSNPSGGTSSSSHVKAKPMDVLNVSVHWPPYGVRLSGISDVAAMCTDAASVATVPALLV